MRYLDIRQRIVIGLALVACIVWGYAIVSAIGRMMETAIDSAFPF